MTWMNQREAVAVLGVSSRTLSRHIASGELSTRREGRLVLVDVPDDGENPVANVAKAGSQLAEVTAANAIQRSHDADMTNAIWQSWRNDTKLARRSARWGWSIAFLATAAAVGVVAVVAVRYHDATIEHTATVEAVQDELNIAKRSAAVAEASHDATAAGLREQIQVERHLTRQAAHAATVAGTEVARLQAERDGLAGRVDDLEQRTIDAVIRSWFTPPASPKPGERTASTMSGDE